MEQNKKNIISELFELCSIPSVSGKEAGDKPFGKYPDEAMRKACELAERYGMKTDIRSDRGYAVCSLGDGKKSIAVMGHVDVVPPGDDWTVTSPFEPVEKDGFLFGRGVSDDKCGVIAGIYVQRAKKELNLPIKSKLLTVIGACEETGMEDINNFAADNEMPDLTMVADAGFPVCRCEKDISDVVIRSLRPFEDIKELAGGTVRNAVAGKAFARFENKKGFKEALAKLCETEPRLKLSEENGELVLRAEGMTAHAAHPENSVNAIAMLTKALSECEVLSENDRKTLSAVAKAASDHYGSGAYVNADDADTGKLTCVCGLASTENGKLVLDFNIRVCRASNREKVVGGFTRFCGEAGFEITYVRYNEGYYRPSDDPCLNALLDAYKEVTGKIDAKPYVMGGGTYARYLKNAVAFGPGGSHPKWLPAGHGGAHEPDEAMGVEELLSAIKIYILAAVSADKALNG